MHANTWPSSSKLIGRQRIHQLRPRPLLHLRLLRTPLHRVPGVEAPPPTTVLTIDATTAVPAHHRRCPLAAGVPHRQGAELCVARHPPQGAPATPRVTTRIASNRETCRLSLHRETESIISTMTTTTGTEKWTRTKSTISTTKKMKRRNQTLAP